ncbi:MAG: hypothetical protein KBA51_08025 [Kiritimatiellae bacterium]|nr:hypothetical protein [Kiritimatiellia bacterium]
MQPHVPTASPRPSVAPLVIGIFSVAFFYGWPRMLVAWIGPDNPWTPYGYLYGNGFIVFGIGLWTILRSGACRPGRGRDRYWLGVLLAGFVFFAALHAAWILASLYIPVQTGA